MNKDHYLIKNYTTQDYHNFSDFLIELTKLSSEQHPFPDEIFERLNQPGCIPEKQLFLAVKRDKIVGYLDMVIEIEINRIVIYMAVHPDFRQQGIGSSLFNKAKEQAKTLGTKKIHINVPEKNIFSGKILYRWNFKQVRTFWEMICPLDKNLATLKIKNFFLRPLKQGEEDMLTEVQNSAFQGSWGFKPNTKEEICYQLSLIGSSPRNVIGAFDNKERLAAYCWTRESKNNTKGRIRMLGVSPAYRNMGLGKKVLEAGMLNLQQSGHKYVTLTVDSNNLPALYLYKNKGFNVFSKSYWFELNIS